MDINFVLNLLDVLLVQFDLDTLDGKFLTCVFLICVRDSHLPLTALADNYIRNEYFASKLVLVSHFRIRPPRLDWDGFAHHLT